jgi:hypothetical protein
MDQGMYYLLNEFTINYEKACITGHGSDADHGCRFNHVCPGKRKMQQGML